MAPWEWGGGRGVLLPPSPPSLLPGATMPVIPPKSWAWFQIHPFYSHLHPSCANVLPSANWTKMKLKAKVGQRTIGKGLIQVKSRQVTNRVLSKYFTKSQTRKAKKAFSVSGKFSTGDLAQDCCSLHLALWEFQPLSFEHSL